MILDDSKGRKGELKKIRDCFAKNELKLKLKLKQQSEI